MANGKISEQQAQSFFEKMDSSNEAEAENAFVKLKEYLENNNMQFSDWIKDKGDLTDLKTKFDNAGKKNRLLKSKIKTLEERYSSLKAELNNI
jgi:hypothetical protein